MSSHLYVWWYVRLSCVLMSGLVTVFPCGSVPTASSLNFGVGQTIANGVTTKLSATGSVCLYNSCAAQLVVDVAGFEPA